MKKTPQILLFLLLSLGIGLAQIYVVGFELHRFYAPSWIFITCAVLLIFVPNGDENKSSYWIFGGLTALSIYLALRGQLSDVPVLTHKEYPVFFYGMVTFLSAYLLSRNKAFLVLIIAFSSFLLLIQLGYNLVPEKEFGNLPKAWGEAPGQTKMFGFFRHHNPFASYCALNTAVLAGLAFIRSPHIILNSLWKVLCLGLAVFTIFGAYVSGSRLGTGASLVALLVSGFMCLGIGFLFKAGKSPSLNKTILVLGIALFSGITAIFGVTKVFEKVSEQRGKSGDVQEDISGDMRIPAAGIGFALWMKDPVFGKGPRAYSYYAPRLRAGTAMPPHVSDAEMVHNDYIQTLAEYGIIGLLLIIFSLFVIVLYTWRLAWQKRSEDAIWYLAPVISTSAVCAVMVHNVGDFTMHNTPIFIQLSLILGSSYGWVSRDSYIERGEDKKGIASFILKSVLLLISLGCFIWIGHKQIFHNALLVKYDFNKWMKGRDTHIVTAREAAQKAPDPFILEDLSIQLLKNLPTAPAKKQLLLEVETLSEKGYEMHPYRLPLLTNYARVKLDLGKLDEAENLIIESFECVGEGWKRYELGMLAEVYLLKKGEAFWRERKPELAMAYFNKALDYNQKGYRKPSEAQNEFRKNSRVKIENYVKTLDSGKVKPQENVEFFNGYGL